jgi:N-acetylglucosamine kinase-like BadF-type ATPase
LCEIIFQHIFCILKFYFTKRANSFILQEKHTQRSGWFELPYTIGIDGGGTKTEAVALELGGGKRLAAAGGGASNAFAVGFEQAVSAVTDVLERLWRESGGLLAPADCAGICIGLAGVDRDEDRRKWRDALLPVVHSHGVRTAVPLVIGNDAEIALFGTVGRLGGLVAVSGTGSIVYGIAADGRKLRAGGWGHLLGDGGSGYAIGLRTLQTVMDSYDGVRPPTRMTGMVLELLGIETPPELKDYVYAPERKKQDIAAFAGICIAAGEKGDEAALRILRGEAEALAAQTAALVRRHPPFAAEELVLAGSIFTRSAVFREAYEAALREACPQLRPTPMRRSAAHGAALLAAAPPSPTDNDLKEPST